MRVGTVCYATEQGIGYLAKQFYEAGIITDVVVYKHPHISRPTHMEWYPSGTKMLTGRRPFGPQIDELLSVVDVMLFFETPFDWPLLSYCRSKKVGTALMPMYEWSPTSFEHRPDAFLCPSLLDVKYFPGSPFVPVPVNPNNWKQRYIARSFLHNAGHLGSRWHKGTLEILRAIKYVKSPIQMTIRAQDIASLADAIAQAPEVKSDSRVVFEGDVPYSSLFEDHDVFVMAEKYNGLSLPIQEARAAGMVVMTSNRFPMNTWLPEEYLIPVNGYSTQRVSAGHNTFEEAHIRPEDIAAKIDEVYEKDVSDYSLSGKYWAEEMSWESLKPRWLSELEKLVCR